MLDSMTRLTLSSLMLLTALSSAAPIDFSHQIVPILREHCAECHTGDKKKGGLSMNDRASLITGGEDGAVVEPGKSAKSSLIEAITSTDPDEQMPPKGKRVPAEQVALLKQWIDEGLVWEEGFAFKKPAYEPPLKPRRVALPAAVQGRTNPVDRLIDSYLAQHKIARPAPLDDSAFLRRAHLDIIGLLPTAQQVDAFLADKSADKRAKLVQALLADDLGYAEHWLTFWNDLLRNDYGGAGFTTGGRKQVTRWLYQSLVANKPFDQLTRELIAPPTDESRGFIDGIKWRGDVSAGQTVEIQFAQSVGQSFLGINLKCASCHDSFIDRWKLDEAYGLAAIYSSRELDVARCDKPTGKKAQAAWLFPELGQIEAKATQPERLQQLAALMTHPENGRVTRTIVNRLWHRMMGRGIVHPLDAMQTEPWSSDLLDYLAVYLADQHYDLKKVIELIATSQAYQSKAQVIAKDADEHGYVFAGPRAKRLTAEQFVDAVWQITGTAPAKFDAPVVRGKVDARAITTIKPAGLWIWGDSAKDGKLPASGETIVLRKQATLAQAPERVMAAITCDNSFELYVNNRRVSQGDNWANVTAAALGSTMRKGVNTITVIATNAGNGPNAAGLYFDARVNFSDGTEQTIASDATWTWSDKKPTTKESRLVDVPDATWQPVTVVKPLPVWSKTVAVSVPKLLSENVPNDPRMIRASLMKLDLLTRTLGRPNREQIVSVRPNDLTTLEAIDLANGPGLASLLEKGSPKIIAEHGASTSGLMQHLFKSTLSRAPTHEELADMQAALGGKPDAQGVQDVLWAILMMPEFQFVR